MTTCKLFSVGCTHGGSMVPFLAKKCSFAHRASTTLQISVILYAASYSSRRPYIRSFTSEQAMGH